MTREQIQNELAERAALSAPEVPPGLTEDEEIAWLRELVETRRREMGITPVVECPPATKPNAESLAASP